MQTMPEGVHVLSAESQAALARAKEKGDAITARHTKPGRLAAATMKTHGPVTVATNGQDF